MSGPLKDFTRYRCLACRKFSISTGAPNPALEARYPTSPNCRVCGAALVEEVNDGRLWRVTFEMLSPAGVWCPVERTTHSEHDARDQYRGLLDLVAEGEIRNPALHVSTTTWEVVT